MKNIGVQIGTEEKSIVDSKTGEVLDTIIKSIVKQKFVNGNDRFFMIFSNTLDVMKKLDKVALLVLVYFGIEATETDLKFTATKFYKRKASLNLGMAYSTVSNAIQRLYKHDVIRRVDAGIYVINPEFFWKGVMNKRPVAYGQYLLHKSGSDIDLVAEFEKDNFTPKQFEDNANL
jgi:hypothetical protein